MIEGEKGEKKRKKKERDITSTSLASSYPPGLAARDLRERRRKEKGEGRREKGHAKSLIRSGPASADLPHRGEKKEKERGEKGGGGEGGPAFFFLSIFHLTFSLFPRLVGLGRGEWKEGRRERTGKEDLSISYIICRARARKEREGKRKRGERGGGGAPSSAVEGEGRGKGKKFSTFA